MQQIAVRRMQFDKVETGLTGVGSRLAEIVNDARDLFSFQGAWGRGWYSYPGPGFVTHGSTGVGIDSRRGNRSLLAWLQAVMGNTAYVPQLNGDMAVFVMHRLSDLFPRGDLLWGMQPRCAGIAFRLERNLGGFCDNQTRAGTLGIIFPHQRRRDITRLNAAQARQRGHKHAVRQGYSANLQRGEQFFNLHSASYINRPVD
ncbi:hypothetical protein D3C75_854470 [compost metagenome]